MGFSIGKVASVASTAVSVANLVSTLGSLDVSGLNSSSLGSLKGKITSALNGETDALMSDIQSAIVPSDIESMASSFNIEGKANELASQIQVSSMDQAAAFDQSKIDAEVNQMMESINSQVSSSMDFSSINYM